MAAKKRKIHSFLDYPGDEWLMGEEQASQIILDILFSYFPTPLSTSSLSASSSSSSSTSSRPTPSSSPRILLPGIGKSKISVSLFKAGFVNITLMDIEDEALEAQRKYFTDMTVTCTDMDRSESEGGRLGVFILKYDVLSPPPAPSPLLSRQPAPVAPVAVEVAAAGASVMEREDALSSVSSQGPVSVAIPDEFFDVVVDKGFMDVFLRQGSSRAAWLETTRMLNQTRGLYISMSMFHSKWKPLLARKAWPVSMYAAVEVPRFSRTRPSVSRLSNPIAVIVSQRSAQWDEEGSGVTTGPLAHHKYGTTTAAAGAAAAGAAAAAAGDGAGGDDVVGAEKSEVLNTSFVSFHSVTKSDLPIDAGYF